MAYIDGVLAPVRTDEQEAYRVFAEKMSALFKRCGAIGVVDAWGDDVPEGKLNSMRSAVLLEPGETVVFSWIHWPDKATRDAGWEQAMQDPMMQPGAEPAPMDGKRMIFGGFEAIVGL